MVVVKLKCKGKQEVDEAGKPMFDKNGNPVIVPDLPEHRFLWRINNFNELTGEFEIITELESETEAEKLKDYIDDNYLTEQEQKIAAIKQLKQNST